MQLRLKSFGYLISIVSVILLGSVAWKSASEDSTMLTCLVLGMVTSILGIAMRWAQFLMDLREKGKI